MRLIKKLNKWANSNTYYPIDILRIALGLFFIYKGLYFLQNSSYLPELLKDYDGYLVFMLSTHYLGIFHFVGGIMIVFGLLTRLAIIVQVPILIGAVAINFISIMNSQNLIESSIVLLVSLFFLFFGSGKHSMDYDLKMQS
ncbi:MAG: putative oxidoreductase [Flavobacteriales bacterium]|jgi:putative oxidoreductase|tara:strand:- start:67 stop:489 length:423 start_codon:yes stop_codon:yes gene_type:complete